VDYDEVFAPVAQLETVRLLIALAAHGGLTVHHMDVKSAFLNRDLSEEVYVHQPAGFVDNSNAAKVLRLRKALYGLKQAPRAWNARLDKEMVNLGFERSSLDHAVYKRISGRRVLLVGVYVDDLITTGPSDEDIGAFKKQMKETFRKSDLGLLSYYLGIEVSQSNGEITLSQSAYTAKILEAAGMSGCNSCHVPMENKLWLSKKDGAAAVESTNYRSVIGSLRYLVNTRPDIAHAVGIVSRFMEAPSEKHWTAVKQTLRHLSGTLNHGCCYKKASITELVGYSDSDLAEDVDDRKSTSGMVFFLGSNLIT
jgi:hypothetical protein